MAKSATFQVKNNTNVFIGTEATMGTAVAAGGLLTELPVTDYSFSEIAAGGQTLNAAPFRVGGGLTQSNNMVKEQRHDRMYEVSVTFMCTDAAVKRVMLNMIEDGASGNISALIGSMPSTLDFKHNTSNAIPVSLVFRDLSHDADNDIVFRSCMATSMTFSGDIGSNGGIVMCTAVFQTAYAPTANTDLTYNNGSNVNVSAQQTMFNMHDISASSATPSGGSAEDLLLFSFELNIARTVTRVGFDSSSSFDPMGYALGGYEVTGSLNAKRDGESVSAIAEATSFALDIDTGVYQILAPTCLIDSASISFDDDGFKQVIPFRAVYSGATSSTIVSFAGSASDS